MAKTSSSHKTDGFNWKVMASSRCLGSLPSSEDSEQDTLSNTIKFRKSWPTMMLSCSTGSAAYSHVTTGAPLFVVMFKVLLKYYSSPLWRIIWKLVQHVSQNIFYNSPSLITRAHARSTFQQFPVSDCETSWFAGLACSSKRRFGLLDNDMTVWWKACTLVLNSMKIHMF